MCILLSNRFINVLITPRSNALLDISLLISIENLWQHTTFLTTLLQIQFHVNIAVSENNWDVNEISSTAPLFPNKLSGIPCLDFFLLFMNGCFRISLSNKLPNGTAGINSNTALLLWFYVWMCLALTSSKAGYGLCNYPTPSSMSPKTFGIMTP